MNIDKSHGSNVCFYMFVIVLHVYNWFPWFDYLIYTKYLQMRWITAKI